MSHDAIIDTLLARVRTLEDEREQACEDLGANDRDSLRGAAQRVVRERDEARAEVERLRARNGSSTRDDEAHELRRVLTGALNDAISAQKAKATTVAVEQGRRVSAYRTAVARLDELRDAHNKLQSLQVDYSHARMLLGGLLRAWLADDLSDKTFHFNLAQEYFEVRE
jgi:hypothetical protein